MFCSENVAGFLLNVFFLFSAFYWGFCSEILRIFLGFCNISRSAFIYRVFAPLLNFLNVPPTDFLFISH